MGLTIGEKILEINRQGCSVEILTPSSYSMVITIKNATGGHRRFISRYELEYAKDIDALIVSNLEQMQEYIPTNSRT